ncbi:MAG: gliding motility-associated ABC transporter substrate-binding protein GldG [Cytophagales bacterium]|nr:gliding motility-associated ABC transporter substrate-binding protein GldG [Cytophagales bacterium]
MSHFGRRHNYSLALLILLLVAISFINFFSYRFFFRMDLTEDQRYSINEATKKLLSELKDEVSIKVYLAGDLPTAFKRLQHATKELLAELKVYSNHKLQYKFIDSEEVEEKQTLILELAEKGIQPTNLYTQEKGKRIEKLTLPGALLAYQDKEVGIMLLKGNKLATLEEILNQSIEGLEYELVRAVRKLTQQERKKIALLRGHEEPDTLRLIGLAHVLREHYDLFYVNLLQETPLANYDAVLITKPQKPFSESEKYLLDQYIMQGGKVLFFLDRLRIDMDSLRGGRTFAFPLDIGLDDQLFRYGIRINQDLVQDLNAGVYPIVVGNMGNQPQLSLLPWPFFPILNNFAHHLIVKNLDALYAQFISSIDTVKAEGVTKTPLVFTSPYARKLAAPVQVDLETLREAPSPDLYTKGPLPIIYLLEGRFTSLYKNRLVPETFTQADFLSESQPTKLLITTASSLLVNQLDPNTKQPRPWGYDPFLQYTFAHEDFLLNTLAYMLDEHGLINAKNKTFKIRLLDKPKVEQARLTWQLINLLTPLVLLLLWGWGWNRCYKRNYK